MTDLSYVPGAQTALVIDGCWVLLDAAPDAAAIAEIWRRMGHRPRLDDLLGSLSQLGFDQLPSFALLIAEDDRLHLICRGRASATLIADGLAERIDGVGLATWREHRVPPDATRVVLGEPPSAADLKLPASAGIFLAQSVTVVLTRAPRAEAGTGHMAPDAARPGRQVTEPASDARQSDQDARAAALTVVHVADAAQGARGSGPERGSAAGQVAGTGPTEEADYDFLFAATQARTIEGAAIRPGAAADTAAELPPVPPSPATGPRSAPSPDVAEGARPERTATPSGLIDAVPWLSGPVIAPTAGAGASEERPLPTALSSAAPHPATSDAATPSDADEGLTVRRSDLPGRAARDRIGPTVHAVLCTRSHANPPDNTSCRVCGTALPRQEPVTLPRPVLGVLRLSTGDVITLDRGVVMGRNPSTDFDGEERPHVVKLPSGDGEISRTHLKVSIEDWQILVTDLKSTNGTVVALPGREPTRLHPDEPLPIQPGTVVTLADGIDFRYEVD